MDNVIMKRTLLIVLCFCTLLPLFAAPKPAGGRPPGATPSSVEPTGADVIAFVRLTGTSSSTTRNKTGQQVRVFTCYGTAERLIKGAPAKTIRWNTVTIGRTESLMEKSAVPALEQARLARPPTNPVYLVFLKRVGEAYRLNGTPGFALVLSTSALKGTDRVDWAGCRSVDEATAAIQHSLRK